MAISIKNTTELERTIRRYYGYRMVELDNDGYDPAEHVEIEFSHHHEGDSWDDHFSYCFDQCDKRFEGQVLPGRPYLYAIAYYVGDCEAMGFLLVESAMEENRFIVQNVTFGVE